MAKKWVEQIFTVSAQAKEFGIVRRSVASVEKLASVKEVVDEAKARGFHVIETGDQLVVLCHAGDMQVHC